jgi:hypothetical protein
MAIKIMLISYFKSTHVFVSDTNSLQIQINWKLYTRWVNSPKANYDEIGIIIIIIIIIWQNVMLQMIMYVEQTNLNRTLIGLFLSWLLYLSTIQ